MKLQPRDGVTTKHSHRLLEIKDSPVHLIRTAHRWITAIFEANVAYLGLTTAQFVMLWTIDLEPDLEQGELAALAGFDPATTGGIISRLEKLKLVKRKKGNRSRRGWAVRATSMGHSYMKEVKPHLPHLRKELFHRLTDAEQEVWMQLTTKLLGVANSYSDT